MVKDCHSYIWGLLMLIMPQNGQVAVSKCSPIWKKMRKSFKTLSDFKAQVKLIPKFENGKLWLTTQDPP